MQAELKHIPVALERCIELLAPALVNKEKSTLIDCTLGLGGHANALLSRFPNMHLIGIDRDQSALAISKNLLAPFQERINLVHATYDQIDSVLENLGIKQVDAILFDLGVSSMQLDQADRGFSYSQEAPLDMRMDQSSSLTAKKVLDTYSKSDLVRVIRNFGEERFASRIVDSIIKARESGRLNSTRDLAEIVKSSIPAPARRLGGNPSKRTFQALRIEVNSELSILDRAIPRALKRLKPNGRMVVMSFHSLEDKIVKRHFADVSESKTPRGLPVEIDSLAAKYRLVFRGSEGASQEEIDKNSRAQSVRLRAIERVAS